MMAPKMLRRLKKKSGGHTTSLIDREEISDQIRHLLSEREKLYEILRTRDESIFNMHQQIAEMKGHCTELQTASTGATEELHGTKVKLFDALNQNTHLRNDVKLALKCVQRETGDESLSLAQLAMSQSSWRGRAQQICALQNKIAELRTQSEVQSPDTDQRVQQLRKIDAQRKQELEQLHVQLLEVKRETEEMRQKWNAQRVRNKILQDEVGSLRMRVSNLSEKSDHDDGTIAGLKDEITQLNNESQDKSFQMKQERADREERIYQMQVTIDELLRDQTANASKIASLRQQNSDITTDLKMACGDFLFSCRDLRKDEYMAIVDVLQGEKEGLLEQVAVLQQRLDEQRQKVEMSNESLRRQNIKYSRLDFKYNECVKEQNSIKTRNRRTQRIAEYTKNGQPMPTTSATSVNPKISGSATSFLSNASSAEFQMNYQMVDLKNKLDIQTERIRMLQDQIVELTQEKDKDDQLYRSIIAKSKSEFAESLSKRKTGNELGSASHRCDELTYQPGPASLRSNTARTDITQISNATSTSFQYESIKK